MKELRILVVDDYPIMRQGISTLLEARRGWKISGEADSGQATLRMVKRLKPEIILLDLGLPDIPGLEIIPKIIEIHPNAGILALAEHESGEIAEKIFNSGARGLVLKSDRLREIIDGVGTIARGGSFRSPRVDELIKDAPAQAGNVGLPSTGLTSRELQILKLLAEGKTNKELGAALDVSVRTVEAHRASLMRKLDLRSVSDLIYFALRNRIVRI